MTKSRALQKSIQYKIWGEKNLQKAKDILDTYHNKMKDFDWTQPILIGHHSQKRHEKIYETRRFMYEKVNNLELKGQRMLEKSRNLEIFANTHKGDAEKKREIIRKDLDNKIVIGQEVKTVYGLCIVLKINKKTYRLKKISSDWKVIIQKHLCYL